MGHSLSVRAGFVVMVAWASLASPAAASGHDEGVRAEVLPPSTVPGGAIVVTAADLTPNRPVRVQLVTGSGPIDIASGSANEAGQLELPATVPQAAVPRYYEIHVVDASGVVAVGYIEIQAAVAGGERDQAVSWPWLGALAVLVGGTVAIAGRRSRSRGDRR